MKTLSFVISDLAHEERRAILPEAFANITNKEWIAIEKGYGEVLGISDQAYKDVGVEVVSRGEALMKDVICDLKIGEAQYLEQLVPKQTVFGWVHAENNQVLVETLLEKELTVIAWEDMYDAGRHVFWKNNQLAGEAAILHAFTLFGKLPSECRIALMGRGNVSIGAHKVLSALGAKVKMYNRDTIRELPNELSDFDVVVNGILWDKSREDHLINREDLQNMKPGSMIIDISADEAGAIETSKPTSFDTPTYVIDGILHYVVAHTPTIFHESVSATISEEIVKYADALIEGREMENSVLADAVIIREGQILDEKLKK